MKKSTITRKILLLIACGLCLFLAVALAVPQSVNGQSSDPMSTPMANATPVADTTQYPITQPNQMGQMGGMGSGTTNATNCPMMSGSMTGGAMSGSGMMMGGGTMGSMTGMNGMSNMPMQSMGTMQGGMTTTGTQTGFGSNLTFWYLNPWWLLGWAILGLLGLAILGGLIVAIVWLIRRLAPVRPPQMS